MSIRAIFLDKDGTLIDDVPYNADPRKITLRSGAGAALRMVWTVIEPVQRYLFAEQQVSQPVLHGGQGALVKIAVRHAGLVADHKQAVVQA